MPTTLDEAWASAAKQKLAETAAAILDGSCSYIEGAREIVALRSPAMLDQFDPDILPFVGVYSETDALPVGKVRELWAPEALKKLEPEFEQKEQWARSFCEEHCVRLIERFARQSP